MALCHWYRAERTFWCDEAGVRTPNGLLGVIE